MSNKTGECRGTSAAVTSAFIRPPNDIVDGDGFYVSYNGIDTSVYGCETTALVRGQMEAFYLLNGDHRAGYAPLVSEGFEACMDYFISNIDRINARSERPDAAAPRP